MEQTSLEVGDLGLLLILFVKQALQGGLDDEGTRSQVCSLSYVEPTEPKEEGFVEETQHEGHRN